jgi:hypothetical protein
LKTDTWLKKKPKPPFAFWTIGFMVKTTQVIFSPHFWLLKVETFQNYFIIKFFLYKFINSLFGEISSYTN